MKDIANKRLHERLTYARRFRRRRGILACVVCAGKRTRIPQDTLRRNRRAFGVMPFYSIASREHMNMDVDTEKTKDIRHELLRGCYVLIASVIGAVGLIFAALIQTGGFQLTASRAPTLPIAVLALTSTPQPTYTPYPTFTPFPTSAATLPTPIAPSPTNARSATQPSIQLSPTPPIKYPCALPITQSQVDSWKVGQTSVSAVQDAVHRMDARRPYDAGAFAKGTSIPSGVLVETNFDERDGNAWTRYPVMPVVHSGSWGLFQTTGQYTAPNDGACMTIVQ